MRWRVIASILRIDVARGALPRGGVSRRARCGYAAWMRKPSLTVDTFVAALAVLGVTASSVGCSRGAPSVSAEPAPQSSAPLAPGAKAGSESSPVKAADEKAPEPPAQPTAAAAAAAAPSPEPVKPPSKGIVGATAVDGGKIRANDNTKNPSASCGAGSCTPDMRKGSGN